MGRVLVGRGRVAWQVIVRCLVLCVGVVGVFASWCVILCKLRAEVDSDEGTSVVDDEDVDDMVVVVYVIGGSGGIVDGAFCSRCWRHRCELFVVAGDGFVVAEYAMAL